MVIRNFPLAQSLYMKYCRETDMNQLKDIYNQEDDFRGQAFLQIQESFEAKVFFLYSLIQFFLIYIIAEN